MLGGAAGCGAAGCGAAGHGDVLAGILAVAVLAAAVLAVLAMLAVPAVLANDGGAGAVGGGRRAAVEARPAARRHPGYA